MNLLEETLEYLSRHGKTESDIRFVLCRNHSFSWKEAKPMFDFVYDDGYGGQEVESGLKVVGVDFWLERHEYDGSEWWEFKQIPTIPEEQPEYPFSTFREHDFWIPGKNDGEFEDYIGDGIYRIC